MSGMVNDIQSELLAERYSWAYPESKSELAQSVGMIDP
jgi:hypothetical protein